MIIKFSKKTASCGDTIVTNNSVYMIIYGEAYMILDLSFSKILENKYKKNKLFNTTQEATRYIENDLNEKIIKVISNEKLLLTEV